MRRWIKPGIATVLLGHWIDTGVILAVVVINALIGFVQEGKAEKTLEWIRRKALTVICTE